MYVTVAFGAFAAVEALCKVASERRKKEAVS